jgi:HlyD family secretion protein
MRPISRASIFGVLFLVLLAGCQEKPKTHQGWVEADLVFVGPDEAGRIQTLAVSQGDRVEKDAPLLSLDADLQDADVVSATAAFINAQQTFDRLEKLVKTGAGTQKDLDAAQATLRDTQARLNAAKTRLARRKLASPVNGAVEQVYYRPGEMVPAGKPVLALLPPENLKVRFFVPQALLPTLSIGDDIQVRCDGCAGDLTAKISFIARSAEYTPPVIYSLEERAKLVFLIEARPNKPAALRVGQPVDIALPSKATPPKERSPQETKP